MRKEKKKNSFNYTVKKFQKFNDEKTEVSKIVEPNAAAKKELEKYGVDSDLNITVTETTDIDYLVKNQKLLKYGFIAWSLLQVGYILLTIFW